MFSNVFYLCFFAFTYYTSVFADVTPVRKPTKHRTVKNVTSATTQKVTENTEPITISPIPISTLPPISNSTVSPTSTTEVPADCPQGKSLNSEEDIKVIMEYIVNTTKVIEKITPFMKEGNHMISELMDNVNNFLGWIKKRPQDLEELLNSLAQKKHIYQELTNDITSQLKFYPEIEQSFSNTNIKLKGVMDNLRKHEQICKLFCEDNPPRPFHLVRRQYDEDKYYCSSIEDLHANISTALKEFVTDFNETLHIQIQIDKQEYARRVEEFKTKLKNIALQEFGIPMYNLLELQDKYYNFENKLKYINLLKIQENISAAHDTIAFKITDLSQVAELYKAKCMACMKQDNKRLFVYLYPNGDENASNGYKQTLLNKVIQKQLKEIEMTTNKTYNNLFSDLKTKLNYTHLLDEFGPLKEEIIKLINVENGEYVNIDKKVPWKTMDRLKEMETCYETMILNTEKAIEKYKKMLDTSD